MATDGTAPDALTACVAELRAQPVRWLVTGSAGFIGSHLLEALLRLGQPVTSLDNFATGHRSNLDDVRRAVGESAWRKHRFYEADVGDPDVCRRACEGVDIVLHEAALGSVPRSIEDPLRTHAANLTGFLNLLVAARDANVKRFIYAGSSSVYGDLPELPKREGAVGRPLSPYAVTKYADDLYAQVFASCYGMFTVGLRYFNVFGPRQDPEGAYAAVIPRWMAAALAGAPIVIHGDGETSRDFCYISNVVQANLLAATVQDDSVAGEVYNVAAGARTSLNDLYRMLRELIAETLPKLGVEPATHTAFRQGDVRHSQADISRARRALGYSPTHDVAAGLREALAWYAARHVATVA